MITKKGTSSNWLSVREEGLYIRPADAFVDPVRPVKNAIVTHAHSDHARAGHGNVYATPETLAIMKCRYGNKFTENSIETNLRRHVELSLIHI